jgi:acyl-CoA dehydrogenase
MDGPIDYGLYERGRDCNYWDLDRALQRELRRRADPDDAFLDRLADFGETVGATVASNADTVAEHPPELRTYDRHGERINEISYHPAHRENERIVYENGLAADLLEAPPGREAPLSSVEHRALMHLLGYAYSTGLGCPLSMTVGAAFLLREYDDGSFDDVYDALTARDYDDLVTGAMFLTEKQGGSDVGANEVRAEPTDEAGVYRLYGEKWFCSNPDAGAALVLARRPDAPDGIEGLSLFCLSTAEADPETVRFRRLKDKLGTTSVPTAEIEFEAARARIVGEPEEGFRYMTTMLNRIRSFMGAGGGMARAVLESRIHAANRETWGKRLADHPLMRRDLVDMTVAYEAALVVGFEVAALYDRLDERLEAADSRTARALRILIPASKFHGTRTEVDLATQAMEIRGGDGYVEEQVHPRMVRNAHVSTIWEGASNVVALDTLRAMTTERAHEALLAELEERLDAVEDPRLDDLAATVADELDALADSFAAVGGTDREGAELAAKELTGQVFDAAAAVLLLERAEWRLETAGDAREALIAEWFVSTRLGNTGVQAAVEDRLPVEAFDAIVRFDRAEPGKLTVAPADD